MKKILVPTDFSASATRALDYALQIARRAAGEIYLLHVCSLPDPGYAVQPEGMQEYNSLRIIELQGRLGAMIEALPAEDAARVHPRLVNGDAVKAIVEKAEEYDADLIVMGTRGVSGLKERVLGTRTAAVLGASFVPVLAVPEEYNGAPLPERMVLAVQEEENEFVLAPLFALAELLGAQIETLIFTDEEAPENGVRANERTLATITRKWQKDFAVADMPATHLQGSDFHTALDRYTRDNGIGLVAMVTHRQRGLQSLFYRSYTREQACHTRTPLLSLHA